jgi:hypothetical protein
MLERMRLVDMAHTWASSMLQGLARYLGRLSNCGQKYGIDLFPASPIHPASPVGGHSFVVGRIGVHSPDVPENGGGNQVQHC